MSRKLWQRIFLVSLAAGALAILLGFALYSRVSASPEEACSLLDDATARGLMSGAFETKLLVECGRQSELGGVKQEAVNLPAALGVDVLVNDPSGDSGPSRTQSETSLAISDSGVLCSGYNDSYHGVTQGTGYTGFSSSADGGATWIDHGPVLSGPGTSFGDPAVAYRRVNDTFYIATLHTSGLGLYDLGSACDSVTWVGNLHVGGGDDKELMAIDNNPASPFYGRLYVAWTNFSAGGSIQVTHSDDTTTWSTPVTISVSGTDVQGAWPVVDPNNGDVYVAWVRWNPYPSGPVDIEIARSTNGGTSFSLVTNPLTGAVNPRDSAATSSCGRPALNGNIRYLPSPQIAVDQNSNLHVVYSYDPDGFNTGDVVNVYYRRSTDNGTSWESEIQLNDDATTRDQYFPALTVSPSGVVGTYWYDRRLDANNFLFDYYGAISYDNGATFSVNSRVSDVSSPVILDPNLATCYHGDYDTSTSDLGQMYIQWADDRNGDPDVWLDTEPLFPDFTLDAAPTTQEVCAPADALYDVDVGSIQGFSDPVTLSTQGEPAGTTSGFSVNPVIPPGTSVLTIGSTGAATPGSYMIDVVGVAPTSTHTTTVGLNLYDAVPGTVTLVSPGDGAVDVPLVPTYVWNAATQGSTYNLEVATDSGFTNIVYTATVNTTVHDSAIALAPVTTYYWHVAADNACGSGVFSSTFSFTTVDIPPVLLVDDDDNSPDVQSYYTAALDNLLGAGNYDIWDTNNSDNEPTLTDLAPYTTVIWFTGDEFGGFAGPGAAGEAALGSWLDLGNCLFISSQDYHYDRGQTPFMTSYLGVGSVSNDSGNYTSVTGQGSVYGGLGPYALSYPFTDYSDIVTPGASAELAFDGNNGNDAAINKDSGVYRTTFWGYPWEAISDALDREEAMLTTLSWCGTGAATGTLQGTVTDFDSGLPLDGADILADNGMQQFTAMTNASGDYVRQLPIGTYTVTASATNYLTETVSGVLIITGTATVQDFALQGSSLTYSPPFIEEFMDIGDVVSNTVTVTNTGPLPINWQADIDNFGGPGLLVRQVSIEPLGAAAQVEIPDAADLIEAGKDTAPTAEGLGLSSSVEASPLAAGDVINSWPAAGLPAAWGVAFDGADVWVSSPGVNWGGNSTLNEYMADGTPTGVSYPYGWNPANGPADATFNWNTGMLWVLDVGQDNCIHEYDPASGETGNLICPSFAISQRGLAYDPATDTYLAGGWNDSTIYRFATDGSILEQVNVGLAIAGLAYNPDTMHLFVIVNASPNPVYVLDAANNYNIIGQFNVSQGFSDYSGAGLEFDCTGNLWGVDQTSNTVYLFESGEAANLCAPTFNWAYAVPNNGTIPANSTATFEVVFDASSLFQVGDYTAELSFSGSFVNTPPVMPLTMHLSCPTCGILDGSITDALTGNPLTADIHITGPGGFDVNLTGDSYAVAVQPGDYDFTVSANGYLSETATVTAVQGATVTTDFALIPALSFLEFSPPFIEEFMEFGEVVSNTVTVTNTGAVDMNWTANIGNYGGPSFLVRQVYIPPEVGTIPANNLRQYAEGSTGQTDSVVTPSTPQQGIILDQQPNQSNGIFSDASCDLCGGPQVLAENFSLPSGATIGQIVFWTGYYPGDVPIDPDQITVIFHQDSAGLPGPVVSTESNVSYDRIQTGVVLFGVHEWMHTLTLASPVTLGPGIYWVEIYNDTGFGTDDMFWEVGNPDTVGNGLPGSGFSFSAPGSTWNYDTVNDLAIQLIEGSAGAGDWASAVPDSGTIPAYSTATFEVVFDSRSLFQVGDYTAELSFSGDFANTPPVMPLTMHLSCPNCGSLEGTVTGLGYCDANPAPLEEAEVSVMGSGGGMWSLMTNEFGYYSLAIDAAMQSPVTVTVSYPEHEMGQATDIQLTAGMTTTVDFDLRWLASCVSVAPNSFDVTVGLGYSMTEVLELMNAGAASTPFEFAEQDGGFVPGLRTGGGTIYWNYRSEEGVAVDSSDSGSTIAFPGSYQYVPDVPSTQANVLVYTDDWIHTTPNTLVQQAIARLGIPATVYVDGDYTGFISALTTGGPWDLVIWSGENYNISSYPTLLPELLAYVQSGGKLAATYWRQLDYPTDPLWTEMGFQYISNYVVPPPAYWWEPSHPIFNNPESAPEWITRVQNSGTSQGTNLEPLANGLAVAGYTTTPMPNEAGMVLRDDGFTVYKGLRDVSTNADADSDGVLDGVELWENIITGFMEGFGADIPWLYEEPVTGTVGSDSSFFADLIFDASVLTQTGDYTGTLKVKSDDPMTSTIDVPVTLHVVPFSYGVELGGDYAMTGIPNEIVMYTLVVTNASNGPEDTFDVSLGSSVFPAVPDVTTIGPLAAGASASFQVAVQIPDSALPGESDAVDVTVTSQGDNTKMDTSRLTTSVGGSYGVMTHTDQPEGSGVPGGTVTYTLSITNIGTLQDTIVLTYFDLDPGWTVHLVDNSFDLAGGQSVDTLFHVYIPANAAAGDMDTFTLQAKSWHDPSKWNEREFITTVNLPSIYLPIINK